MNRVAVTSSNIASIGFELNADYDPKNARGTLEVEFKPKRKGDTTGEVWRYFDVPAALRVALMVAPSVGTFFHKAVRMGGFRSEKLGTISGEVEALYRSWDLDSLRGMQTALRSDLADATDDDNRAFIIGRMMLIERILTERGETP